MSWTFIDIQPMGAPRQTRRDKWAGRPVIERYHAFKDELRLKVGLLGGVERMVPAGVLGVRFQVAIPKSRYKAKKGYPAIKPGMPHQQRPDLDNFIKAFKDALMEEDSHVWKYAPEPQKTWAEKGGIWVWIPE